MKNKNRRDNKPKIDTADPTKKVGLSEDTRVVYSEEHNPDDG